MAPAVKRPSPHMAHFPGEANQSTEPMMAAIADAPSVIVIGRKLRLFPRSPRNFRVP